jgi:type IV pilus assembly protein PilA
VETRDQKIVTEPTYFAKGKKQSGFTIIELMMVIAIVSILATIALAAYSNFTIRSKVAEGLGFASEAKTAVTSYYAGNNKFPFDNNAAGLPPATSYGQYDHIDSLEVENDGDSTGTGVITVTIGIPGLGAQNQLQLVPTIQSGSLTWVCRPAPPPNGIDTARAPSSCRG